MIYTKQYTVLDSQIDISEHLCYVQYLTFIKSAFFSLLQEEEFTKKTNANLFPIVFSAEAHYHKEIVFNEQVVVKLYISDLQRHKHTLIGEIYNHSHELSATVITKHGIMNRDIRKIEPLNDKALEVLTKYSKSNLLEFS
ncbi:thioesterase family protein [Thiotrichales bacterium 19X7-9]|nr:thioesterase family protein [Thiotrichales bacterium 19X7-9]